MKDINVILEALENHKSRSAWGRGVLLYAQELAADLAEAIEGGYIKPETITSRAALDEALRNGADSWKQFSWGGCSLIYNGDIAERLCNPSELKKTRNGERRPNAREEWLDTQARALFQAAGLIMIFAF